MRRLFALLTVAASAALVLPHTFARAADPTPAPDACAAVFCAGAARGDITPPVTTPMWGYTAREVGDHSPSVLQDSGDKLAAGSPADALAAIAGDPAVADKTGGDLDGYCKTFECNNGIETRLYANAFVLRDAAGTKLALVEVDLGGLPAEVHQAVADKISAATGIDAAHLMISATHTHQGPGGIFQYQGYALLGGDEFDPRVFGAVVGGISRAVERADSSLTPARMAWAQTEADHLNHNRDMSEWCLNPDVSCDGPEHWSGQGDPPNNRTLTVMRLDTTEGEPIGVITNLGNHGTIGGDDNLRFSGDNQAFAVRDVEAAIADEADSGGTPGTPSFRHVSPYGWPIDALLNAAQGDQSPDGDKGAGWNGIGGIRSDYAAMEGAGLRQAQPVLDSWRGLGDKLTSDVTLDARMEEVCFCGQQVQHPGPNYDGDPLWDHVSAVPMLGAGGVTLDDGTASPAVTPTQGRKQGALAANGTSPQAVRLQQFRIGSLLIGTIPGEPTVQLGRHIIKAMEDTAGPGYTAVLAGLADDYISYFTTQEEYRSYNYEASFSLYGPQSGELLLEEQAALTRALQTGASVPACSGAPTCPAPTYPASAALDPTPLTVDFADPAITVPPPSTATAYQVVTMTWLGGSPSAEWRPDADHVRVQRLVGSEWRYVTSDALGYDTLLSHATVNGQHFWTADWEVSPELPPGTYRFEISGGRGTAPGQRANYTLDSAPITVTPFKGDCAPKPDPNASFRYQTSAC